MYVIKFSSLTLLSIPPSKSNNQRHNISWRYKIQIYKRCNETKISQIDGSTMNVLILSVFGLELAVKMNTKESLECGRMHLWALKTQNPCHKWLALLTQLCFGNFRSQKLGPLSKFLVPNLLLATRLVLLIHLRRSNCTYWKGNAQMGRNTCKADPILQMIPAM